MPQTAGDNLLVLIHAPNFENYGPMKKAAGTYFPLGLGYISAYVKQHGYSVVYIDPNVQDLDAEAIARIVAEKSPLLVGVSFMTPQFFTTRDIIGAIKERCAETSIVLGGAHPNVMPDRTLREMPNADFVAFGEGEKTTLELLDVLSGKKSGGFGTVDGILWRDNGTPVKNPPREAIADLDTLPYPDRSLIDQSVYRQQSFLSYSKKIGTIHTSRGCPARCVFCSSGRESLVRTRSIDNVMGEIDELRRRNDMDYLLIKDDTFTFRRSRVREFCEALKGRHPGLKWHCMGRVNTTDEDILSTMKSAGLNDIFFGIESGNDDILKRCGKGSTTALAKRAVEAAAKFGVRSYGAFILGLPGETHETIKQTIDFACSLPLTMAGFSILIPYPGTQVFADYYNVEEDEPIDYKRFVASSGIDFVEEYSGMEGINVRELPTLIAGAQRRFYLRPIQIARLLRASTPSMFLGYLKGLSALVRKELYLKFGRSTEGVTE